MTDSNEQQISETIMSISKKLITEFTEIVGTKNALTGDDTKPFTEDRRRRLEASTKLVLCPESTEQVSQILKLATKNKIGIVPQGGNTGLVGAGIPNVEDSDSVIVSMKRLNKIISVGTDDNIIVVEAGAILQDIQTEAKKCGRLFPLSLSAEGSCQIGGNISSNAGGTNTLEYGNTRDLVTGLEVVLPTGKILDSITSLKKDNTGYNLNNLFVGAEGTLGIITKASLKLYPLPQSTSVALVGVETPETAIKLLNQTKKIAIVTACEIINKLAIQMVGKHCSVRLPDRQWETPWDVLIETISLNDDNAQQITQKILEDALEQSIVRGGVVAQSESQKNQIWEMRHNISDAQKYEGASIKNDVAVPVSKIPEFLKETDEAVKSVVKDARIVSFGHLGDGNIHYNISQPTDWTPEQFFGCETKLHDIVGDIAIKYGGTFSAEHGIGQTKKKKLEQTKSSVALNLMKKIKKQIDPAGIMNPNKIF